MGGIRWGGSTQSFARVEVVDEGIGGHAKRVARKEANVSRALDAEAFAVRLDGNGHVFHEKLRGGKCRQKVGWSRGLKAMHEMLGQQGSGDGRRGAMGSEKHMGEWGQGAREKERSLERRLNHGGNCEEIGRRHEPRTLSRMMAFARGVRGRWLTRSRAARRRASWSMWWWYRKGIRMMRGRRRRVKRRARARRQARALG